MLGKHLYKKSMRPLLRILLWSSLALICLGVILFQNFSFVTPQFSSLKIHDYAIVLAHFYSVDQYGRPYKISAERTLQRGPRSFQFSQPIAYLEKQDGTVIRIGSPIGLYQQDLHRLQLSGGVVASNMEDYKIMTEDVMVELSEKTASGRRPVWGHGTLGHFKGQGGFFFRKGHLTILGPVEATLKEKAGP
jgi:hypothetical protein